MNSKFIEWCKRYVALVRRYQNIIKGQLFGHNHEDSFQLFKNEESKNEPFAFGYINPTLGTFSNNNPSFKIYYIDKETYEILDHETYRLFIKKANEEKKAEWKLSYRFSDYYGYSNANLKTYVDLSNRLIQDKELTAKYVKMLKTETEGWERNLSNLGIASTH